MSVWPIPLTPAEEASVNEVHARLGELIYLRQQIENYLAWPDLRVILPRRLHEPFTHRVEEGPQTTVIGLPVVWSDREEWGVLVALSEPDKET